MARLRSTMISAMAMADEIVKTKKIKIEDAAKQAAKKFNENPEEVLQRIYKQKNKEVKQNVRNRTKTAESYYSYNGEVLFKTHGKNTEMIVTVGTKETDFSKAKDVVRKHFFDKGFNVFITEEQYKNNLSRA